MTRRGHRLQRWVAGSLLAVVAVLVLGIPLPTLTKKPGTEPFPCQDSPCGCATASQCWDKCCCNNDRQKLEWAREHRVAPPEFLVRRVALAERGTEVAASCSQGATTRSCCQNKHADRVAGQDDASPADASFDRVAVRVVLMEAMYRCQGIERALRLLSETVVDWKRTAFLPAEPFFLYAMAYGDESSTSLPREVDPPVPWRSLVS